MTKSKRFTKRQLQKLLLAIDVRFGDFSSTARFVKAHILSFLGILELNEKNQYVLPDKLTVKYHRRFRLSEDALEEKDDEKRS